MPVTGLPPYPADYEHRNAKDGSNVTKRNNARQARTSLRNPLRNLPDSRDRLTHRHRLPLVRDIRMSSNRDTILTTSRHSSNATNTAPSSTSASNANLTITLPDDSTGTNLTVDVTSFPDLSVRTPASPPSAPRRCNVPVISYSQPGTSPSYFTSSSTTTCFETSTSLSPSASSVAVV